MLYATQIQEATGVKRCCLYKYSLKGFLEGKEKVASFEWSATSRKFFTIDNVIRRGMVLENMCIMCDTSKNVIHLLSHCLVALELWNFIFVALGDTNNGRKIASASALKFQDFQEKSLENYIWCLTWDAWRDRNGSTFEE